MFKIFYFIILFAPFLYSNTITISTGEWTPWVSKELYKNGIGANITNEAFKTQNIKTEFHFFPWKRAYIVAKVLKNDTTGFWLKNPQREKDFYFSDSVFSIKNKLISKKGVDIDFNTIDDLKKYKIAITRGYSYTSQIDTMIKNNQLNIYIVNNDLAGLKQVLKKEKFDAFLCSDNVAKSLIKQHFTLEEQKRFHFSSNDVFQKDVFLMVSKNNKNHKEILKKFNTGLNIIKNNGVLEKILDKTSGDNY
ncbi:MAG: transporter substrate-binding domain-containing protein [Campylobacterota bacterium]|nr:transporter substrate-binding domain-containing protein [Campylobacterota bacterium]